MSASASTKAKMTTFVSGGTITTNDPNKSPHNVEIPHLSIDNIQIFIFNRSQVIYYHLKWHKS